MAATPQGSSGTTWAASPYSTQLPRGDTNTSWGYSIQPKALFPSNGTNLEGKKEKKKKHCGGSPSPLKYIKAFAFP